MDSTTVLPKPYHSLPFFFNLMKYDQSRAFDRAKWVKWRAKREQLRDLELRRDDLDEELRRVTFVAVCPLISKHTRANVHCTKCDRRIIKSRDMWLTIIAEPLTKIESLLELSYVSTYCEIELEKNEKHRHTLEKEILQVRSASLAWSLSPYAPPLFTPTSSFVHTCVCRVRGAAGADFVRYVRGVLAD